MWIDRVVVFVVVVVSLPSIHQHVFPHPTRRKGAQRGVGQQTETKHRPGYIQEIVGGGRVEGCVRGER